jgi:CheY-like chemotaxis protein
MPEMTNTRSRHIVLIDDDADDYNVLNYIIEDIKADARVTSVTDTENFITRLKTDVPDVILLDLAIPKKSGFECLVELRNGYCHR